MVDLILLHDITFKNGNLLFIHPHAVPSLYGFLLLVNKEEDILKNSLNCFLSIANNKKPERWIFIFWRHFFLYIF